MSGGYFMVLYLKSYKFITNSHLNKCLRPKLSKYSTDFSLEIKNPQEYFSLYLGLRVHPQI